MAEYVVDPKMLEKTYPQSGKQDITIRKMWPFMVATTAYLEDARREKSIDNLKNDLENAMKNMQKAYELSKVL
jgi:hypothetical protein